MSKRVVKRIVTAAVILLVLGALAYPKLKPEAKGAGEAAVSAGGDTLQVSAYVVGPTTLFDRIITTGNVQANEAVDLVSESSGKVTKIYFKEGSFVHEGDLLLKINDTDLIAQREQATFRLKLAQARAQRQRPVLEKGGISQEQYDETLNEVNVLKAQLELIDAQIAKTEIHAPFNGVVGLRYVSEGAFISPQTRIATLQQLNPVKVEFTVPEQYANEINVGDEIVYHVRGSDKTFTGRIYAAEPRVARDTRTLGLRAVTPNPDRQLMPGAFANINVILHEMDKALVVPAIAVVPELNGKKVYVYENGHVAERQIETGIRTDSTVQVLTGLAAGDTVITTGLQLVRPGLPVNIQQMAK
ncbi:MAG TPA: efflux RND transporter periplasmic adaptor subunit [Rhodothermales bacterium]|nr:efflux RND transporter periplasmic adaptor subunit [Rhodothermales bacterium]